jgi:hypothetical protein
MFRPATVEVNGYATRWLDMAPVIIGSTSRAVSKPWSAIEMRDITIDKASRLVLHEFQSKMKSIFPTTPEVVNAGNLMTLDEVRMSPNICIVDRTPDTARTLAMYTTSSLVVVCFASLLCQIDEFSSRRPSQRRKNADR